MEIRTLYTLTGELLSPIIASKPLLKKGKVWIRIVRELETNEKPLKSYVGKLIKGERKIPDEYLAYRGFVRVTTVDCNETRGKETIKQYLRKEYLGSKKNDGLGKVKWLEYKEEKYKKIPSEPKRKKFRIRKGLGTNYPKKLQRLLRALMLHDFVHTERHMSKIFQEVEINDEEIREACQNHHVRKIKGNNLHPIVRYFDQVAAYMNRKTSYLTKGRYDFENGKIDFVKLAKEIEARQESTNKLYDYILKSIELDRVVVSFRYARNSLKNHLLLMVNLAITSYYNQWLKISREKVYLVRNVSTSIDEEDEDLNTIRDAEMHRITSMSSEKKKALT